MWKKVGLGVLVFDLVVINGAVGYLIYKKQIVNTNSQIYLPVGEASSNVLNNYNQKQDGCGEECQKVILEKIAVLKMELAAAAGPSASPKIASSPTPQKTVNIRNIIPTKSLKTTYVAIPGSGSSQRTDWENLGGSEFYFNPADYPGLKEIYFEANLKLFNGNGMAYVRLFDVTHGIGVQGSDVQTNSQANSIVVSGRVSFWAGNNLIRVQAKSLTADTAVFNSGRLRIIQEN